MHVYLSIVVTEMSDPVLRLSEIGAVTVVVELSPLGLVAQTACFDIYISVQKSCQVLCSG
jgi:hypothetical protein